MRGARGRWAVVRRDGDLVVGGAGLLVLPPGDEDLELGLQLAPAVWGNGFAAEAAHALAAWAFDHGVDEVFSVVRPENSDAAAVVRQNGMEWVGETTKYFGETLKVFRLRRADLDHTAPAGHRSPRFD